MNRIHNFVIQNNSKNRSNVHGYIRIPTHILIAVNKVAHSSMNYYLSNYNNIAITYVIVFRLWYVVCGNLNNRTDSIALKIDAFTYE